MFPRLPRRAATVGAAALALAALAACSGDGGSASELREAQRQVSALEGAVAQFGGQSPAGTTVGADEIARALRGEVPERGTVEVAVTCVGDGTASVAVDGDELGSVACAATAEAAAVERIAADDVDLRADHEVVVRAGDGDPVLVTVVAGP